MKSNRQNSPAKSRPFGKRSNRPLRGSLAASSTLVGLGLVLALDPLAQAAAQAAPPPAGSYQVTVTDLGLLPGGQYASAYALNDTGMIAGVASDSGGQLRTVRWINGQIAPISGLAPSGASVPTDINDAGEISGTLQIGVQDSGIYWDAAGQPFKLQGLPGVTGSFVRANGINAFGRLVGRAMEGGPNLYAHAALWQGATFLQDLGFLSGGTYSEAYGNNELGDIVGVATLPNQTQRGFLWRNGQFTDLSTWSGGSVVTRAFAINNYGEIAGLNNNVAALFKNGAVTALAMPAGVSAFTPATDINDAGDVIATGTKLFPVEVGVLWRQGQALELPPLPGGTISRARHINQAGEVVGESNTSGGFFHAVKWTITGLDWSDLGQALAGQAGLPQLKGAGQLAAGSPVTWSLLKARANAPAWFVVGASPLLLPIAGGVLVPSPDVLFPVTTTAGGTARLNLALQQTPAAGLQIRVQAWILDPAGIQGWAASNALLASAP